jgi:hypothetical protein
MNSLSQPHHAHENQIHPNPPFVTLVLSDSLAHAITLLQPSTHQSILAAVFTASG